MTGRFEVMHTTKGDLTFTYELFEHSIKYQEERGYPVWRNYDRNAIVRDIEEKNHYKIVVDAKSAIVFSVCYKDEIIWRERERSDAIYLHRIVVNPEFKGQRLFGGILEWAISHCKVKGLRYVRMDTWAANPHIVAYYKSFGFGLAGSYTTPDTEELPVHNRNLALTLLEYEI